MAAVDVNILAGQSNAEGTGNAVDLPASLRGPQANRFVWNHENGAIETLNCDAAGANQPNNNTLHTAGKVGIEMSLSEAAFNATGVDQYLFKYAIPASPVGPTFAGISWNYESQQLFLQFLTRWNAFSAALALAGHTIRKLRIFWYGGESDAIVDGNDLAFYGLFKRFIRDIRSVVDTNSATQLTVPWTTMLIADNAPNIYFANKAAAVKNVRAGQYKAGWHDIYYRVFDTNQLSHDPADPIHLDSSGVYDGGIGAWNAYLLDSNNSMPFETYNLGSLRTRLAEEFGIDITINENLLTLDKRINDAVAWIITRRKSWPWLEVDTTIDVGEPSDNKSDARYGAGVFNRAQRQVVACTYNLTALSPREVLDFDARGQTGILAVSVSGNLITPFSTVTINQGYQGDDQKCTITSLTVGNPTVIKVSLATEQGGTATLPTNVATFGVVIQGTSHSLGNYNGTHYATRISADTFSIPINSTGHVGIVLGTARIAKEFRIAQCFFELPEDFIKNSTAFANEDTEDNRLFYRPPHIFEREIRDERLRTRLNRIYTTLVDPLSLDNKKYMAVYPYYLDRNSIFVKYFRHGRKLLSELDEPDVPISDRFVVWYAAAWFVAQWQKDTAMVTFYRDGAMNELERMAKEYQFTSDLSEAEEDSDDLSIPQGPDGFPEFEEP